MRRKKPSEWDHHYKNNHYEKQEKPDVEYVPPNPYDRACSNCKYAINDLGVRCPGYGSVCDDFAPIDGLALAYDADGYHWG